MTDYPKTLAKCDLFGTNGVILLFDEDTTVPNRWVRFWTSFFLNSKWTLYTEDNS